MRSLLAVVALLPLVSHAEPLPDASALLGAAREAAATAPSPVSAPAGPVLTGHFPEGAFPERERVIADIWGFVKTLGGARADLPPPILYFSPFDPAKQDADWTAWQKTWADANPSVYLDWLCSPAGRAEQRDGTDAQCGSDRTALKAYLAAHPAVRDKFPFPASFRGFHYDGTARIQIDPIATYMAFWQNGPYGPPAQDLVGSGYSVTGHELLHPVLASRGVPGATHHCLFVTPDADGTSPMEKLTAFLISRGYASFAVRRYGYGQEVALDPCAHIVR